MIDHRFADRRRTAIGAIGTRFRRRPRRPPRRHRRGTLGGIRGKSAALPDRDIAWAGSGPVAGHEPAQRMPPKRLSENRSNLWARASPVIHEPTPTLEQVRAWARRRGTGRCDGLLPASVRVGASPVGAGRNRGGSANDDAEISPESRFPGPYRALASEKACGTVSRATCFSSGQAAPVGLSGRPGRSESSLTVGLGQRVSVNEGGDPCRSSPFTLLQFYCCFY